MLPGTGTVLTQVLSHLAYAADGPQYLTNYAECLNPSRVIGMGYNLWQEGYEDG